MNHDHFDQTHMYIYYKSAIHPVCRQYEFEVSDDAPDQSYYAGRDIPPTQRYQDGRGGGDPRAFSDADYARLQSEYGDESGDTARFSETGGGISEAEYERLRAKYDGQRQLQPDDSEWFKDSDFIERLKTELFSRS